MTRPSLEQLLHHPRLWRGLSQSSLADPRTGHAALDRLLPGRGWPRHALIEVLTPAPGVGEISLLLPSLQQQPQTWIAPPYPPYAPALAQAGLDLKSLLVVQPGTPAEGLWAMEQLLRGGTETAVLGWFDTLSVNILRRLQLAAEAGATQAFVFRPAAAMHNASPAALRLFLDATEHGLYVRLIKVRGGRPASVTLPFPEHDPVVVPASAAAPARSTAFRAA